MNRHNSLLPANKLLLLLSVICLAAALAGCSGPQPAVAPVPSASPPIQTINPAPTQVPPPATSVTQPSTSVVPPPPPASPSPTSTTTTAATPTPAPSPAPAVYTPAASPFKPTGELADLFQYMLELINQDRRSAGLTPVTLNSNAAAQKHAQDMLDNRYLAHWGTDGLKPYMRFTAEGGLNYEQENSAYSSGSGAINAKTELQSLHNQMMNDDAAANWAHKNNILNKWHKKVNLGIAYDKISVALVQQFEGDYIEFYTPPTLTGNTLSLSGRITRPDITLDNISMAYDDPPQPLTAEQLNKGPYHSYGPGKRLGFILPPPPPGQQYANLPGNAFIASKWEAGPSGQISLQADIGPVLNTGKGVYTVVLVTKTGGESLNLTNYSIFIR